jgi:hypothetical protein
LVKERFGWEFWYPIQCIIPNNQSWFISWIVSCFKCKISLIGFFCFDSNLKYISKVSLVILKLSTLFFWLPHLLL